MFVVVNCLGSEVSRHRALKAAGRVVLDNLALKVRDREGRDVTFSAKDSVR